MPKCTVATQVALAMLPSPHDKANYLAHHGNVCDNSKFNVQYVQGFDLVFNALDNVTARRRVNRLCLAASVPLIEAGTTGYLGQVTVIDKPSNVECYECQAKPTQKVYPICTIRSTPSMPVHTIVWAKELYKLLFHPKVEDSMLFEDQAGEETSTYMDRVMALRNLITKETQDMLKLREAISQVIVALYNTEIQKQLDMDRFKTAQKVPTCIEKNMIQSLTNNEASIAPSSKQGYKQTDIPSKQDCIEELVACILDAKTKLENNETVLQEFDKDCSLAMRFVTCSSNLRSYVFGIEPIQSYYSAKGIAGNIIPAIATTNAIVAGLQILQGFHILKKQVENKSGELNKVCSYTYCLRDKTRKGFYLQPTSLPEPNPKCFVCKNALINLSLDTSQWTLEALLRRIIKKELGFMEPSLNIGSSIIYEEGEDIGEDEYAAVKAKKLVDLPAGGVQNGTIITIEDFTQDLEVELCINHKTEWEPKEGEDANDDPEEQFIIGGDKPVVKSSGEGDKSADKDNSSEAAKSEDADEDIEIMDTEEAENAGRKRSLENDDDDIEIVDGATKKARTE